ncbi:hypothetical protein GE061_000876 [Apolygus lucorum]|uniref:Uncharacterized protein n=1 Tax=Apolygus lucorum TaxID=248454 RepID=A0A8S9Y5S8_APOLU|nr:hypothetical protein GE061_000876 [Apolygus lucorum]
MDDDEVVLEGSELEKLLLSVREDVETFSPNPSSHSCPNHKTPSSDPPIGHSSDKTVLAELICLKELLLSCGLMLDEDISFLVNEYPDHQERTYLGRLDHILLPGCCLTTDCLYGIQTISSLKSEEWDGRAPCGNEELDSIRKKDNEINQRNYDCSEYKTYSIKLPENEPGVDGSLLPPTSCTNEELGFPALTQDSTDGVSITKLEELCIEYLVMQSEYLRALGMWLCSPMHTNPDEVSSKISIHKESIARKHKMAQQVFNGALFTRYLERTNLPINGSTDVVVTKIHSALTALVIEALSLKSSLNEIEDRDGRSFEFGLSNLESCISDCTEIFKEVRSYSRKRNCTENNQESAKCTSEPGIGSSTRKTGVEVGHTDFSVSGEDKVYLCITDVSESMENINDESSFMDESPKYPNTLLNELRCVLEEKRIEFRQRESNAIKNSDLEAVENQFDLPQQPKLQLRGTVKMKNFLVMKMMMRVLQVNDFSPMCIVRNVSNYSIGLRRALKTEHSF